MPTWLIKLFHSLGRKQAAKVTSKREGITQIPTQIDAEGTGAAFYTTLREAGFTDEALTKLIKSEKDIIRLVNKVESMQKQQAPKVISQGDPQFQEITEKLLGKKAKVHPFQGMTPRIQQDVDSIIKDLKNMEPMAAMKEANLIIGRKGKYKNLSGDEAQRILKDTDDHIFQRDIQYDEFGDPIKPDPEDMASGGRVPLFKGKIAKGILSLGKKKKPKGKIWKDAEGETQGIAMGFDAAELKELDKAMDKGTALSDAMKKMGLDPASSKDYFKFEKLVSEGMSDFSKEMKEQIIRAKYGDIVDQKLLDQMLADTNPQRLSEVMGTIDEGLIMQQKGMNPDEIVETIKTSLTRRPQQSGGLAYMLGEPNTRIEALQNAGVVVDPRGLYTDPSIYSKGESEIPQNYYEGGGVGRGPWTTGPAPGITEPPPQSETPVHHAQGLSDPTKIARGLPSVAPRTMDPQYIQQQRMQQIMMQMGQGPRPMAAEGGRIGFDKGKKVDLSKRRFLKGTGAAVGLLSMIPFVGKFFKPAAKALGKFKGTPNLVVDITKTPNMPEWYIPVIKKVLNKGDEVTDTAATAERQTVHRDILPDGDEVTVTQNIDAQTIDVSVANPKDNYLSISGAGEQPYTIQYSKGKVIEEGKYKGQKEPDKLEVDEPYVNQVGPDTKDVEIEFDIMDYNPKAEVHNTAVLETYATGKKVKPRGTGEVRDPWEGFSPDLKDPDIEYAKGGLAYMLGE